MPARVAPRVPPELLPQLDRFLFDLVPALDLEALEARVMATVTPTDAPRRIDFSRLQTPQIQRLLGRVAPIQGIALTRLCRDWQSRLALLPAGEWLKLGFAVSALPFCGHAQRSMDGNFRRALRDQLGPDATVALDACAGPQGQPQFMLAAGAWKSPELVAMAGVRSAFEQACPWGEAIRRRFILQFPASLLETPASVAGLDETWLEIACKLSLQDHLWLWS